MGNVEVYASRCKAMEVSIECFVQTASISIIGKWKNKTDQNINCVFMIPMRGIVTDCIINIGSERVRSVSLAEKEMKSVVYNQEMDMEREEKTTEKLPPNNQKTDKKEWDLMNELF